MDATAEILRKNGLLKAITAILRREYNPGELKRLQKKGVKEQQSIYFDGYESDRDRVKFTCDGVRYYLYDLIECLPKERRIVLCALPVKVSLQGDEPETMSVSASHLTEKALRAIAAEAFMHTNGEESDDVDEFIEEMIRKQPKA